MIFEKSKKSLLTLKLVSCIIINFLKLKELYISETSAKVMSKINTIRDISSFGLDLLSFNVLSMAVNFIPFYRKARSALKYILSKIKRNN